METTTDQTDIEEDDGQSWYYRIELEPGDMTPGKPRMTLAMLRETLKRIDLSGARCLDIGTQEAAGAVSMMRLGAEEVVAYDRLDLTDRISAVSRAYETPVTYLGGHFFQDLKRVMSDRNVAPVFDFVNFAGVLYHMMDPLAGIAMARSFLRENGVMLIETSVSVTNNFNMKFNYRGQLYPGSNYFQVSARTLDYWVRMFRMRIEDVIWRGADDVCRVVLVCRATNEPVIGYEDTWALKRFHEMDAAAYGLDYDALKSGASGPAFDLFDHDRHDKQNLVDREARSAMIFGTIKRTGAYQHDPALEELRLDHAW